MIKSKYIADILDKIVEGAPDEAPLLKLQLPHLTESEFDHTGVGLYVNFTGGESTIKYRTKEDDMIIDGLLIHSSELENGAAAILWIRKGIIDCLEILARGGDYPKHDLKNYKLIQTWIDTEFAPNIIDNT